MKGAREGVRMGRYLPKWATLAEAERWLHEETGEDWPLPRLIEAGLRPHAWAAVRPGEHPEVVRRVYGGRPEGFLSEFIFWGDLQRMAIDRRSIVISMTRTPGGEIVKIDPPAPVDVTDLRFDADRIREVAKTAKAHSADVVKRRELVRRLQARWPTIEADVSEASRNGLAAAARVDRKGWLVKAAEDWAQKNGRIREAAQSGSIFPSRIVRQR